MPAQLNWQPLQKAFRGTILNLQSSVANKTLPGGRTTQGAHAVDTSAQYHSANLHSTLPNRITADNLTDLGIVPMARVHAQLSHFLTSVSGKIWGKDMGCPIRQAFPTLAFPPLADLVPSQGRRQRSRGMRFAILAAGTPLRWHIIITILKVLREGTFPL